MSSLRQVGLGILTAIFSSALVFGSMLLALAEGGKHIALAPIPTNTALIAVLQPGEPTFTPTSPPAATETPTEPASNCENRPRDWIDYHEVMPGETLSELAQLYSTSVEALRQANCLPVDTLYPGSFLSVPPQTPSPTSTDTPTPQPPTATKVTKANKEAPRQPARCSGHPASWVRYKVKKGDTIYRIASSYGITAGQLLSQNCLSSNSIHPGQIIYVPNVAPIKPKRTPTPRPPSPPRPVRTLPPPVLTEPPPVVTNPPLFP